RSVGRPAGINYRGGRLALRWRPASVYGAAMTVFRWSGSPSGMIERLRAGGPHEGHRRLGPVGFDGAGLERVWPERLGPDRPVPFASGPGRRRAGTPRFATPPACGPVT